MRLTIPASVLLLSVISTAHAARVLRAGSWELHDNTTRQQPVGNCVIQSSATGSDRGAYRLEIVLPKNRDAAPEIFVRRTNGSSTSLVATFRNGANYAFPQLSAEGRNVSFYGVPRATEELLAYLRSGGRNGEVTFRNQQNRTAVEISTDGFARVADRMISHCLGGRPLIAPGFEAALLRDSRRDVNPAVISAAGIAELRRIYAEGYGVFLAKGANTNAINNLRRQWSTQIAQNNALVATISRLSTPNSGEIAVTQARQASNDAAQAQSEQNRASAEAAIPGLRTTLERAQQVLNRAEADIAPHRSEQARLANASSDLRGQVNQAQSTLSRIASDRAQAIEAGRALGFERDDLQSQVNAHARALPRAEQDLRRAEIEYRRFDRQREINENLRQDRQFQQDERELIGASREAERMERRLAEARGATHEARRQRDARAAELRACQQPGGRLPDSVLENSSVTDEDPPVRGRGGVRRPPGQEQPSPTDPTRGDNDGDNNGGRGGRGGRGDNDGDNNGGRGGRGGRGDNGGTTTPPTTPDVVVTTPPTTTPTTPDVVVTTPPADCTSQSAALAAAEQNLQRLEGQEREIARDERQAEARARVLRDRLQDTRRRVENAAERMENTLAANLRDANAEVEGLNRAIRNKEVRIAEISNILIPQNEQAIANLNASDAEWSNHLRTMEPQAVAAERAQDAFERRVGWQAKVRALNNAQNAVGDAQANLSSRQSDLANANAAIQRSERLRTELASTLARQQQELATARTSYEALRAQMAPYFAENTRLTGETATIEGNMSALSQQFSAQLPQ